MQKITINNSTTRAIGSSFLFSALFIIFAVPSGVAAFFFQPNLNGIGGILLGLLCATPFSFILFLKFRRTESSKWYKTYLFPALLFPILIALFLGWTVFEQRPPNIFEVFVANPIPNGISNIQAHDISVGFDQEIVVAFDTTPEAIDQIIAVNNLELDTTPNNFFDRNDIPFEYFSNVNDNQDWVFYSKYDRENVNWWLLWVNTDRTRAFFRFVGG